MVDGFDLVPLLVLLTLPLLVIAAPLTIVLILLRIPLRVRGRLVFKAHRLVHHSTLGLRVMKKKKNPFWRVIKNKTKEPTGRVSNDYFPNLTAVPLFL